MKLQNPQPNCLCVHTVNGKSTRHRVAEKKTQKCKHFLGKKIRKTRSKKNENDAYIKNASVPKYLKHLWYQQQKIAPN